ncbi:hypothetical protein B0H13DRAFT_1906866 [Mycena leptocephala]|nr:hypothetical protein B0H13DRAFT_1906866 [Mycena leptocephala]
MPTPTTPRRAIPGSNSPSAQTAQAEPSAATRQHTTLSRSRPQMSGSQNSEIGPNFQRYNIGKSYPCKPAGLPVPNTSHKPPLIRLGSGGACRSPSCLLASSYRGNFLATHCTMHASTSSGSNGHGNGPPLRCLFFGWSRAAEEALMTPVVSWNRLSTRQLLQFNLGSLDNATKKTSWLLLQATVTLTVVPVASKNGNASVMVLGALLPTTWYSMRFWYGDPTRLGADWDESCGVGS